MGFSIQDSVVIPTSGVNLANLNVTCNSYYRLRKAIVNNQAKYYAKTIFKYYVDLTKQPVWQREYETEVTVNDLSTNIVSKLYASIKVDYVNTTDN